MDMIKDLLKKINDICKFKKKYFYPGIKFECCSNTSKIFEYINEYWHSYDGNEYNNINYSINHIEDKNYILKIKKELKNYHADDEILIHSTGTKMLIYRIYSVVVFLEVNSENIIIDYGINRILVITKEDGQCGSAVLRVIREIILRESENQGGLIFHSAAVSYNDKGILICGEKNSGKTSTVINLLRKKCAFIANDRVILMPEEKYYSIYYIPLAIRIGLGTVKNHKDMYQTIKNIKLSRLQSEWKNDSRALEIGSRLKIEMTPKELNEIFECTNLVKMRLHSIVIPCFKKNFDKLEIKRLDMKEAISYLIKACMTPNDENWVSTWLIKHTESDELLKIKAQSKINSIINNYKIYKIDFGENTEWDDDILNIIYS